MNTVLETNVYSNWIDNLRDKHAQIRIAARIRRLSVGNPGDCRHLGSSVVELRIDYGPGYRVYYTEIGGCTIILLAGGDKTSQNRDIEKAKRLAEQVRSEGI
ncbi:MAG: type II toxin-antitoxin system RelE/ParE family toxin [Coriobacteriales bacterium]|jgi:putative addiction module killer protein|nr:type II toxin-antitoxin system RelE/ParE family toxin [Coriobacteriales bacterium]